MERMSRKPTFFELETQNWRVSGSENKFVCALIDIKRGVFHRFRRINHVNGTRINERAIATLFLPSIHASPLQKRRSREVRFNAPPQ